MLTFVERVVLLRVGRVPRGERCRRNQAREQRLAKLDTRGCVQIKRGAFGTDRDQHGHYAFPHEATDVHVKGLLDDKVPQYEVQAHS